MIKRIRNFHLLSTLDKKLLSLDEFYFKARLKTKSGQKKLFYEGWGDQSTLNFVDQMWDCLDEPDDADIRWERESKVRGKIVLTKGSFVSSKYSDWLPIESRIVTLILVKPKSGGTDAGVLIAPTSREIGFGRRLQMANKLACQGITTILTDNPFMGARKPASQFETVIAKFSDYPLMAAACIEENRMILKWMRSHGMSRLCATGVSQGGFTSAAAAMRLPFPIDVISVVPPNSAEQVVVEGIPGRLCAWDVLENTCPSGVSAMDDMKKVFDRTRLDRMQVPTNGTKIHLVAARSDKFVPVSSYQLLANHWKDIGTVEWRIGGHVSTILDRKKHFNSISHLFAV